jgi:hypothetical protein
MSKSEKIQAACPRTRATVKRCAPYVQPPDTKKTRSNDAGEYRQRPEIQEEQLRGRCEQRRSRASIVTGHPATGKRPRAFSG